MIIGLTGGIASGKSTVANYLKEKGFEIVDADLIAKELSDKKEIIDKVEKTFGKDVIDKDGKINRVKLREKVFNNEELLKKLNKIFHPEVIKRFKEKKKENQGSCKIIFFDIPLLYELNLEYLCDKVVVIYVDRNKQLQRLMLRDNNSIELANAIIDKQLPLEMKKEKADIVIDNCKDKESLIKQIENLIKKLEIER